MKRITLLSMALLSWGMSALAQKTYVNDNYIKYEILDSKVVSEGNTEPSSDNIQNVTPNEEDYSVTVTYINQTTVSDYLRNVNVQPSSFLSEIQSSVVFDLPNKKYNSNTPNTNLSVNISGIDDGMVEMDDINMTFKVVGGKMYTDYCQIMQKAAQLNSRIKKGSQLSAKTKSGELTGFAICNDLYYFCKGGLSASAAPNCWPIVSVSGLLREGTVYDESCQDKFIIKNIPATFLAGKSGVGVVNIPSTVTTIEAGAFMGTSVDEFNFYPNGSAIFRVKDGIMYTDDMTKIVAVAKSVTGTVTLDSKVTEIYDYAMYNCSGLTLKTSNNSIVYNAATQNGNKVSVLSTTIPVGDITVKAISGNRVGVSIATELSSTNIKSLYEVLTKKGVNLAQLCYIDLAGCTSDATELSLPAATGVNPNCIVYFPNAINCTSSNSAVLNRAGTRAEASTINIADGNPFFSRYAVHCDNIAYKRSFTAGKWGTIVLPFSIGEATKVNGTTLKDIMTPSSLTGRDGNVLTMTRALGVAANVPYIFQAASTCTALNVQNATIETSVDADLTTEVNKAKFIGMFEKKTLSSNTPNTYVVQNGGFAKIGSNDVNVGAFRFYMYLGAQVAEAPVMRFVDADEMDVDKIEDTNKDQTLNVVAGNGVLTVSAQGEQVVIANVAGQTIYEGTLNGTRTFNVAKGVYVVNDKKYNVK